MGSLKISVAMAGFLAAATSSMAARAADLLPPMPMPEPFEFESTGGWYLRGDVGVSIYQDPKFRSPDVPAGGFYGQDMGTGGFAGAGVGYQFTSWFRADVTGEYRFASGVQANDRGFYTNGLGNRAVSFETSHGSFSSAVVLLNGYFDLGTWHGLTPFVGGGVGYAFNRLHGFTNTSNNIDLVTGVASPGGGTFREGQRDGFAWALHAGVGYDVSPNLKLELAYRYLNLGEARTGVIDCYCGLTLQPVRARDIEAHDIKIGMRWLLGETEVERPPLIRKY